MKKASPRYAVTSLCSHFTAEMQMSSSSLRQHRGKHENSHQTTPAPGPSAAPQKTSGETSRKVRELNCLMGRAAQIRHLPPERILTRWLHYCLNVYRVASGQHPEEIQHTLCEMCGEGADEIDHRLAIEVARAGPGGDARVFTPDNLRWLCRSCHRRKTRQDRLLARFLATCSLDWNGARRLLRHNRMWALSFLLPGSLEPDVSNATSPSRAGAPTVL